MCTRPEPIIAAACTIAGAILDAISGWPNQKPRIVRGLKTKSSGLMDIGLSLIAAKLTSVAARRERRCEHARRRAADAIKRQAELGLTDSRFDPFRDIWRVDDNDVCADRLELGQAPGAGQC
jgi:hypothetical protein